jgi:hypothetical protein
LFKELASVPQTEDLEDFVKTTLLWEVVDRYGHFGKLTVSIVRAGHEGTEETVDSRSTRKETAERSIFKPHNKKGSSDFACLHEY